MPKCHCGKYANYNIAGQKAIVCTTHKEPNMVDVRHKTCEAENCIKIPNYNIHGEIKGRFCVNHKDPNMIIVTRKICEEDGCNTIPNYDLPGAKVGRFCSHHKKLGMINVVSKMCESNECNVIPAYNFRGSKHGRFCADHKLPTMINVLSKTCEIEGCDTQPIYNVYGEIKGRFCEDHKESHMINVKKKTCEVNGCMIYPIYNIRGEAKGRFCLEHKDLNMVDVTHNICEAIDCTVRPHYNFHGEKARFCSTHKELNMVNVISKPCEVDKCIRRPYYNYVGETIGRFCSIHKEDNMKNVISKQCIHDECQIQTKYGLLGKSPTHCAQHKQKGMITSPTKPCETANCKQLGTHEANGMRFCEDHAPVNAENLGIEPCTVCGLPDRLTNGKCNTCDPTTIKIRQHAKENRVRDVLTAAGIHFIHDKMLEGPLCGRERPDFQIDCGTHMVYLEVDEHQHQSYTCECEQTRMMNLVEARGMPVRFIRYNPDVYQPLKGQRAVKIEQREKKVIEYMMHAMKHGPQENNTFADVLYLFYDEYDTTKQEWLPLIRL